MSADSHAEAVARVHALVAGTARTIVVDSPPGAGKSTLVRSVAVACAARGIQVPIVCQTRHQAYDLAAAIAADLPGDAVVGLLHATEWGPPPEGPPPGVRASTRLADLADCPILVATAAKWAFVSGDREPWPLALIDEAYQMSSTALVRVADLFQRLLLVGDPGQLAPFTIADERALRSYTTWPLDTAAGTILRNHPDTPVVALPVSWRLPPSAAQVVADAFYTRPFVAGSAPEDRALRLPLGRLRDPLDEVLHVAANYGWGLLELPVARLPPTDPEAAAVIAALVTRLLRAAPEIRDERSERRLHARDIAVGVTHRDQAAQVLAALNALTADDDTGPATGQVTVDTANRLQGREFDVVIAWHPLSGRRDASAFHLEAGRLCVLASRHRHACIVVSRGGVRHQLAAHPQTEPVWLGDVPPQVDGWEANLRFLEHLERFRTSLAAPGMVT